MYLTDDEFQKLQNLSKLSFSAEEKQSFSEKLGGVIDFLGQLKNLDFDKNKKDISKNIEYLKLRKGVQKYNDTKLLLENVEHEIINNSISISFSVK